MFSVIWNWVLNACGYLFDKVFAFLFSALPNNSVLENFFNVDVSQIDITMTQVGNTLAQFNHIFPFDTLFMLFQLWLFAEILLFALAIFMAVMRAIFLLK